MTNLRGRMLAATRMPLTATGRGPGSTRASARIAPRSGAKTVSCAVVAALTLLTPLFRGDALCGAGAGLHHHLDGVVDALARVFDRGRQVFEREGMRVHFGGVEALLRH